MLKKTYSKAWVYKTSDRFRSGIPDIIICYKGRFLAIELKTVKNDATKLQRHELNKIIESGGSAVVCRSVKEVKSFMEGRWIENEK